MTISDLISLGGVFVSLVSAGIAGGSFYYTQQQWKKVKDKVGMIDDWSRASEILPAWYTTRMMSDDWLFGLLTTDGRTIVIRRINRISDDGKWLDVDLDVKKYTNVDDSDNPKYVFAIAEDRTSSSIQVATIVAAMELQTS